MLRLSRSTRWSEEELNRLEAIAPLYSLEELAEFFDRTPSAIRTKLNRKKIKHKNSPMKFNELETEDTKYCTICCNILPLSSFYRSAQGRKGTYYCCRECSSSSRRAKRIEAQLKNSLEGVSALTKEEKNQIKEQYYQENKGKVFHCKGCQSDKTIDDFLIVLKTTRNGGYRASRECRECKQRREANRAKTRGYR